MSYNLLRLLFTLIIFLSFGSWTLYHLSFCNNLQLNKAIGKMLLGRGGVDIKLFSNYDVFQLLRHSYRHHAACIDKGIGTLLAAP